MNPLGWLETLRGVASREAREVSTEEFPRSFGAILAAASESVALSPDYGASIPHALYDFRVLEVDNRSATATVTVTVNGGLTYRVAPASSKTIAPPNARISRYTVSPSANLGANELEVIEKGAKFEV